MKGKGWGPNKGMFEEFMKGKKSKYGGKFGKDLFGKDGPFGKDGGFDALKGLKGLGGPAMFPPTGAPQGMGKGGYAGGNPEVIKTEHFAKDQKFLIRSLIVKLRKIYDIERRLEKQEHEEAALAAKEEERLQKEQAKAQKHKRKSQKGYLVSKPLHK